MAESYLPWWLILLVGMWAIALVVWQHPSVHRELRWWAGLLTLVYMGFFFVALGKTPSATATSSAAVALPALSMAGLGLCMMISLSAGVWYVGRASELSRHFGYVVITLANCGVAFLMRAPEVAIGLSIVAGLEARRCFLRLRQFRPENPARHWLSSLMQFHQQEVPRDQTGIVWVIGGLGAVLACLLLGTVGYAMRYETSRTVASTRLPSLPSRILSDQQKSPAADHASLVDVIFGSRADVVVLLSVIVFLGLANFSTNDHKPGLERSEDSTDTTREPNPSATMERFR